MPVILTSNKLPAVMREPRQFPNEEEYKFRERVHNYKAFLARCKLSEIRTSHRNSEQFPYSADQLALYMKYLCDTMNPIVEEEYDDFSDDDEEKYFVPPPLVKKEDILAAGLSVAPDSH